MIKLSETIGSVIVGNLGFLYHRQHGTGRCHHRGLRFCRSKTCGVVRPVLLVTLLLVFAGCYPASKEGNRISRIGGDLVTNGRSDDLVINDPDFSSFATDLCGKGNAEVYPGSGDIRSGAGAGEATHHLILRCAKGDAVLRLRYDSKTDRYALVEYFKPKKLRYFAGRWSIER